MSTGASMKAGDDPGGYTVAQVNEYLSGLDPEGGDYDAVVAAERAGFGRKGILGDTPAPALAERPLETPGGVATGFGARHVSGPALD